MATAQTRMIIKESKRITDNLCNLYENRDIDYITFLKHTSLKIRFLRKNIDNEALPVIDRVDIADVIERHSMILNRNNINHIRMVQQG